MTGTTNGLGLAYRRGYEDGEARSAQRVEELLDDLHEMADLLRDHVAAI